MLSLPRDLRVYIEGVGYEKMNAAYSYGGPKAVIRTFKELTGLPINGWIETDFAGFWHTVNILGGVYLPIDRKYFVPASANYKSINLEPGYQLVRGKQALNFVRFRHDQRGTSPACSASSSSSGAAASIAALERGLGPGHQAHQGDHARDPFESQLAGQDRAARGAGVPGGHVPRVPDAPRGRHADARRDSVRDRLRGADRRGGAPFHPSRAGPGETQGRGAGREERVPRARLQRQRHRRPRDRRRHPAERAGLQGTGRRRRLRVPRQGDRRVRTQESPFPRRRRRRHVVAGPGPGHPTRPGRRRRHHRVRRLVVRRRPGRP